MKLNYTETQRMGVAMVALSTVGAVFGTRLIFCPGIDVSGRLLPQYFLTMIAAGATLQWLI
jgi:hypothetical protein